MATVDVQLVLWVENGNFESVFFELMLFDEYSDIGTLRNDLEFFASYWVFFLSFLFYIVIL